MTDDWSGQEIEGEGGDNPLLSEAWDALFSSIDEYDQQIGEAFGLLNLQLDLEEQGDPFAEDADLLLFGDENDPFAEDDSSADWRDMVSEDFNGDLRGPFPEYVDALEYIEGLEFANWEIVYDDIDDVWYAQLAYGVSE